MASLRPRVRLLDIRGEIAGIRRAVDGLTLDGFERNWVVLRAVQHALLIIGEAAKALPDDLKALRPDIPWGRIGALGNFLRHEYAAIDTRRLWDIVETHLQPLDDAAAEMLRSLDEE